jgi:ketosteroid isomerase-like protein
MMQDPNFGLSFTADTIVVARSGDLAYEHGSYTMTMSDPQQKPVTQKGHYLVVWQQQADGAWKVARDVPVSDGPAAPAVP